MKILYRILPVLSLSLSAMLLAGCPGAPAAGAAYVGMYETKPDDLPPAETANQISPHDSWCYETMGYAECYTGAQPVDPNRLINVDPGNSYPLTPQAYRDAVETNRLYPIQQPGPPSQ